jgi:hypothetical protein
VSYCHHLASSVVKDEKYQNFENLMKNNSKMGNGLNGIYLKIAGYVDLAVLIIFTPCQISDIINGF